MTPKWRLVVRYLPDDPVFTVLSVNDDYCRLFGVKRRQVAGDSVLELIAERSRDEVMRKLRRVLKHRIPLLSQEIDHVDGREMRIRWLDIPVMDCGGSDAVVEMIAVGEPIDE